MYIRQTDLQEYQSLRNKDQTNRKRGILIGMSLLALLLIGIVLLFSNTPAPIEDEHDEVKMRWQWATANARNAGCINDCKGLPPRDGETGRRVTIQNAFSHCTFYKGTNFSKPYFVQVTC